MYALTWKVYYPRLVSGVVNEYGLPVHVSPSNAIYIFIIPIALTTQAEYDSQQDLVSG